MFTKDGKSGNEMETIIGPSVHVEGAFVGTGDVVVEGSVTGTLKTSANVRVGQQAKIKADVEAKNLFVAGEIRGSSIIVKEHLELTKTAKIVGTIKAKSIAMETGAVISGKIQMPGSETTAEPSVSDQNSKGPKNVS